MSKQLSPHLLAETDYETVMKRIKNSPFPTEKENVIHIRIYKYKLDIYEYLMMYSGLLFLPKKKLEQITLKQILKALEKYYISRSYERGN